MTYAEYCATKCELCEMGLPFSNSSVKPYRFHWVDIYAETEKICTAPSRDQFEAELQEEARVLRLLLHAKDIRIAELERENAELRKDKAQLSREEWGAVIDGLILEIARSEQRQAQNSESTSSERAEMCKGIIRRLNAATQSAGEQKNG